MQEEESEEEEIEEIDKEEEKEYEIHEPSLLELAPGPNLRVNMITIDRNTIWSKYRYIEVGVKYASR